MKTLHREFSVAATVIAVLGITRARLNIFLCHVNRIPFNAGCVGLDAAAGNDSLSLQPSEPRINERRCHNCALLLVRINDNTAVRVLISPFSLPVLRRTGGRAANKFRFLIILGLDARG